MDDVNLSRPIPHGWELKTELENDGSSTSYYWCTRTGQRFPTYDAMSRYVSFSKEAQLSIYSPEFQTLKLRKKASRLPGRKRPSLPARKRHFPVTSPMESANMEERTALSNPEEVTDTGKNMEVDLDGAQNKESPSNPVYITFTEEDMEAGWAGVAATEEPQTFYTEFEEIAFGDKRLEAFYLELDELYQQNKLC